MEPRVIPILLLQDESLVKTTRFDRFTYVGDPCNTCRIFNELEVDELLFLDIRATRQQRPPNFSLLRDIAGECFMPLGYGGGIQHLDHAKQIFDIGFEKISINSALFRNSQLVGQIATYFGSQAVIASIDVKQFGQRPSVHSQSGKRDEGRDPVNWAREVESLGAGEVLLTSIDREGTWQGLDLEIIRQVTAAVSIPVIAHGGAGTMQHIQEAVRDAGASAVGLGSMVVFQKPGMGVLVHYPDRAALNALWR